MLRFGWVLMLSFISATFALSIENYRVYNNAGTVFAASNDMGNAVVQFRRANLLGPHDSQVLENLTKARAQVGIPAYWFESSPLESFLLFPFSFLSVNSAAVVGLILFALGSVGLALTFIGKWVFPKMVVVASILLVLGSIYIGSAFIRYQSIFDARMAVILKPTVLLERPEENALKLYDLPAGLECTVRQANGQYLLINTIDGHSGWVYRDLIRRIWDGVR